MAPKWTPTRDQNLLLLIIQDLKPDYAQLAGKWKKVFPDEDFMPTAKAVSEHVASLKRKMGGSTGQVATTGSTPVNKNKAKALPKTPTSKPKRSRAEMMSNEDDSEEEKEMDFDTPVPKRTTPSRHRSTPKKYKEEESETENEDVLITSSAKATGLSDTSHSPLDISSRPSNARSKTNPPKFDYFRESDGQAEEEEISDFEPFT